MQTGSRAPAQGNPINKSKIFAITSLLTVAILAVPVIIPHAAHPSMIYHISLHIASVVIAVFLSVVSILAYQRTGSMRILLMTLGFLSLAAIETMYLLNASESLALLSLPSVNIELPHILLLAMLALFGVGVLKVNN